jgi:ribokinase
VKTDVITFGSVTVDTILSSKEFKLMKSRDDMVICERFGAKLEIEKRVVCGGGGGGNTAVGLSRLGLSTALVAKMGDDFFSEMILTELRKNKVNIDNLIQEKGETDSAVILVAKSGGRTVLISRGKTRLEWKDIDKSKLSSRWFHVASLEGNLSLAKNLFAVAVKNDSKVCWNPGKIELKNKKEIKTLLSDVEILVLNQQETEQLLERKMTESSFWEKVMDLPAKMFFLTQGKKGAFLIIPNRKEKYFFPAFSTTSIEDTGAGDGFCSGVIAARIYQKTAKEALFWGLANGAGAVSHFGAKAGLMTRPEIEKVLIEKSLIDKV